MAYTVINLQAFVSAYDGAIAGMAVSGFIVDPTSADYAQVCNIAGAFAQALDTAWDSATELTFLESGIITTASQQEFAGRGPGSLNNPTFQLASNWTRPAQAIVALVQASDAYFSGQVIPVTDLSLPHYIDATALTTNQTIGYAPNPTDGTQVTPDFVLKTKYNLIDLDNEGTAVIVAKILSQNAPIGAVIDFRNLGPNQGFSIHTDVAEVDTAIGFINPAGVNEGSSSPITPPGHARFMFTDANQWECLEPDVPQLNGPVTTVTTDYFVNGTTGSDNNSGVSGHPFQTFKNGVFKFISPFTRITGSSQVTIHLQTNMATNDSFFGSPYLDPNVVYKIVGTKTQVGGNFVLTAVTAINTGAQQAQQVSAAGLGAAGVGKQLVISASADPTKVGAIAWGKVNVDGNNLTTTPFVIPNTTGSGVASTVKAPAVGDTIQVFTLPKLNLGGFVPEATFVDPNTFAFPLVIFQDLEVDGSFGGSIGGSSFMATIFVGCSLSNVVFNGQSPQVYSGNADGLVIMGGETTMDAMGITNSVSIRDGFHFFQTGCMSTSGSQGAAIISGGVVNINGTLGLAAFGSTHSGVRVDGGVIYCNGLLWGNGNTKAGMDIQTGLHKYNTLPSVTGTSGDFDINGSFSVTPWDPTTRAFLAAITTTWANLNASVGAGGFGSQVADPKNGIGISVVALP